MNKKIKLLAIIILLNIGATNAQDSYIKKRWNIKFAYQEENTSLVLSETIRIKAHGLNLSVNYGAFNHFEFGANVGYSANFDQDCRYVNYFINTNYHLLPYFIKSEDFRIDAYLTVDFGGISTKEVFFNSKRLTYGGGIGLAFYPLKHWGIFGEYKLGRYYQSNSKYFIGVNLKF